MHIVCGNLIGDVTRLFALLSVGVANQYQQQEERGACQYRNFSHYVFFAKKGRTGNSADH